MSEKGNNILRVLLNLIIIVVIMLTGINILLKEDLLKSVNLDYETNDFCQTINNASNNLDYLVCDNKFKKNKVILLLIDSLPFDVLHDFHNLQETKMTNLFRSEGIEYKQSGALFETILTGKFSRNYLAANVMKMDNIPQQLKNANMSVFYHIRDFPLGGLVDKKLGTKFDRYQGEQIPLSSFCNINLNPFLDFRGKIYSNYIDELNIYFREGKNQDILYAEANEILKPQFEKIRKQFNDCFSKRDFNSTVFYTDNLDHIIHIYHRNHPIALFAIYFIEQLVKELIQWINEEHGEFALALASDHGGQIYFGEDTLCNHGCNSPGNEGVFFVYTKDLGIDYDKYKTILEKESPPIVSLNDFACTLVQSLKNANLPLESSCTPRVIGNDKLLRFTSVKSKEIQLKKFIEKLSLKYPELSNQYHSKYDERLNNHKFNVYFKDLDSIYNADENYYEEYMKYIIDIQKELFLDVVISGQNRVYYLVFYTVFILFILGILYFIRKLIILTRNKVLKEIQKIYDYKNPFLTKLVKYIYIFLLILFIEPITCIIYKDSINISYYIKISVFIKFTLLLFFVIIITFLNGIKRNNYNKLIFIIIIIIILHFVMCKIELFTSLDKFVNTQKKSDFFKIYLSYPLLFIYICLELYSYRNYYLYKKYRIRYIYILLPYLIILSYYFLKFDLYLQLQNPGHEDKIIKLMKLIYRMIFILLLFIKPFFENNSMRVISSEVININLFLFIMINFINIELERVEMISLLNLILFYLCYSYKKEKDMFLKIIYIILIMWYPQIHFIGNQGTYTMDTSIKATVKCPSRWADDRPIVMGVIFVVNKFRFNIMTIGYLFSLIKITQKKIMNYYTEFIRLITIIQLFAMILCFLYFLKKEKEDSYIQILYLIATHAMPILFFDFIFLINYVVRKIIISICKIKNDIEEYKQIDSLDLEKETA